MTAVCFQESPYDPFNDHFAMSIVNIIIPCLKVVKL